MTAVRNDFSSGAPLPASVANERAVRASARRTADGAAVGALLIGRP
jgi:hypothetical protein